METVVENNGNGSEIVEEKENGRESSIAPVAVGMPNFDVEVLPSNEMEEKENEMEEKENEMDHLDCLSIYKIPTILSRHKEVAYIPNGFSFGPWHYDKPHLQATREIKIRCLRDVLGRAPNPRDKLAELKEGVRKMVLEGRIHRCYAEKVELSSEQLVETLLLDGCFIIEVLYRRNLLQSGILFQCLYRDLILLENQIPWFVLTYLFSNVANTDIDKCLQVLVTRFFKDIFFYDGLEGIFREREGLSYDGLIVEGIFREREGRDVAHILDLLRTCMLLSNVRDFKQPEETSLWKRFVPKCLLLRSIIKFLRLRKGTTTRRHGEENLPEMERWLRLPSASRLKEAGIQFKRVRSRSMLDISFHNGVLEIQSLIIHDITESLFRNLIAYEQCCPFLIPTVASYAKLMDDLIDTVEDIEILSKSGVIGNLLNPEDATQFFNLLGRDVYIRRRHFHYAHIYRDVNSYCKRLWPRWRASYIQNYFAKPWAVVSQIFALVILALTILQVALAILQVLHK